MADIFRDGERREVFYDWGKFDNDQRRKFVRAPFDLVIWSESGQKFQFVDTKGLGGPEAMDAFINATDPVFEEQHYMSEFGFLGEPITVEEHAMGNGADSWMGVHAFSLV